MTSRPDGTSPARYAVVGAGPAGCYAVQQLLLRVPDAVVDVYERRTSPYGLLDLGVAPDHPGTKAVRRQLERALASPRTRLHLGVDVTADRLRDLRETCAGVVLATGAVAERVHPVAHALGHRAITGSDVAAWSNGMTSPELARWEPGRHVVVVGAGNVAFDAARILASVVTGTPLAGLVPSPGSLGHGIAGVHLVSRADARHGPFSPNLLRELAPYGLVAAPATTPAAVTAPTPEPDAQARAELVAALPVPDGPAHLAPLSLHLSTTVSWSADDPSALVLHAPDGVHRVPDASVVSAIGFTRSPGPHDRARSTPVSPDLAPGHAPLLLVGWARSGGHGNLAAARRDAVDAATTLAALAPATTPDTPAPDRLGPDALAPRPDGARPPVLDTASRHG